MKLGQSIKIKTTIVNGNEKLIQNHLDGTPKSFLIIGIPNKYTEYYPVLIEDKMLGWIINSFHVEYYQIDKKYLGKKFYDIDDSYVI